MIKARMERMGMWLLLLVCTCSWLGATNWSEPLSWNNPSFETGTGGYWISSPANARVNALAATSGRNGLRVKGIPGKTVSVVHDFKYLPNHRYRFSLDMRGRGGSKVRFGVMCQGQKKPLGFIKGPELGVLRELPGEFTRQVVEFGPVAETFQGTPVYKLMLYVDIHTPKDAQPGEVDMDKLELRSQEVSGSATTAKPAGQSGAYDGNAVEGLRLIFPQNMQIFTAPFVVKAEGTPAAGGRISLQAVDAFGVVRLQAQGEINHKECQLQVTTPDYYLIKAALLDANGKELKSITSSCMLTTPLPSDYYDTPHPAFGVWGGLNPQLRQIAGAKWDRQLFFTAFQKKDATDQPPTPERIAAREPVKIIRCLNILHPFKRMEAVPKENWPGIMEQLRREISSKRGLVEVWETQNEPMVGENFHGTMEDVVDIITHESRAVRTYDPKASLAGICINPMSANQYRQIVNYYRRHAMERLVDGVMLHPYIPGAQNPDGAGYVETLNRLAEELKQVTGKDIPMYISEIGYSSHPGGEVSELQQGAYLARVAILNRLVPTLRACVWHIGLWNAATSQRENDFALLRRQLKGEKRLQPKPSFAAWATMSRQTYRAELLREVELGPEVRAWLFNRDGAPLLVLYSLNPEGAKCRIAVNCPEMQVTTAFGRTEKRQCPSGVLELSLTEAPVYVAGSTLENFRLMVGGAKFTPDRWAVPVGGAGEFEIAVPQRMLEGATGLRVELPEGCQGKVEELEKGRWRLQVSANPKVAAGNGMAFVRLDNATTGGFLWSRPIQLLPPVQLQEVQGEVTAEGLTLNFVPKVHSSVQGQVTVQVVDESRKQTLAIGGVTADTPCRMPLWMVAFGQPRRYTAQIHLQDGRSFSQQLPDRLVPVTIPYCKDAASLPLEGWPEKGGYRLEHGLASRPPAESIAGALNFAWDEKYLYVAAQVPEKEYDPAKSQAAIWSGDSLQLGVAVAQSDMLQPNNDGIQETAYLEVALDASRSWVYATMSLKRMPLAAPIPGLINRSKVDNAAGVVNYCYAIPWETMNIRPRRGMPLRISLLVNDRRGKNRLWREWYSGIADGKDPSLYGPALLQ